MAVTPMLDRSLCGTCVLPVTRAVGELWVVETRSSVTDMEVIRAHTHTYTYLHIHTQICVKAAVLICSLSQQSGKRGVKAEAGGNTSKGPPLPPRQQQVVPAGVGRSNTFGLHSLPKRSREGANPAGTSLLCVYFNLTILK